MDLCICGEYACVATGPTQCCESRRTGSRAGDLRECGEAAGHPKHGKVFRDGVCVCIWMAGCADESERFQVQNVSFSADEHALLLSSEPLALDEEVKAQLSV